MIIIMKILTIMSVKSSINKVSSIRVLFFIFPIFTKIDCLPIFKQDTSAVSLCVCCAECCVLLQTRQTRVACLPMSAGGGGVYGSGRSSSVACAIGCCSDFCWWYLLLAHKRNMIGVKLMLGFSVLTNDDYS